MYARIFDLLEKAIPYLFTAAAGLIGAIGGRWLDKRDRERDLKREALIEVNKILSVWTDFGIAKLPFELGFSEDYARSINDKMIEAKALLEVVGSTRLNVAFDRLHGAVNEMVGKTIEYKQAGRFDPQRGIEQFSKETAYELFRSAKRNWIDTFRKEIDAEPVNVSEVKSG